DSHNKLCVYLETECSAFDVGCNWKGKRKDQESHHKTCQWIPLRTSLLEIVNLKKDLGNENEKLNKDVAQLNERMTQLTMENGSLKVEVTHLREENGNLRKEG